MKRLSFSFFLGSLFLCACQPKESKTLNETLFISRDFTDSLFTAGIEGPAVDNNGMLYAVSYQKDGTIGKVDRNGKVSLYVRLPAGSTGNGIRFNSKGDMFVADYTGHNLLLIDKKSKGIKVYAHHDSLNQPNDLAIMKNDIIFCSDPDWSNSTGNLWKVGTDGIFRLVESNMGTTNGIEVGMGDTVLYVNESIQRNVWAYTLSSNGTISNKRLLIHFDDYGMDGMRCDVEGNLYIARYEKGVIAVVSPQGKLIREIKLTGKKPTNITFGGKSGKTCFVTLQDRGIIETFESNSKGRE